MYVAAGWNKFPRWQRKTASIHIIFSVTVPYWMYCQTQFKSTKCIDVSLPKHTQTHTQTHTIWYFKESRMRWAIGHFKCHFPLDVIFAPHPNIFSPPLHLLSCLIICAQALCFPLDYVAQVERPWLSYLYSPLRRVPSRNT